MGDENLQDSEPEKITETVEETHREETVSEPAPVDAGVGERESVSDDEGSSEEE